MGTKLIKGLKEIQDKYDAFFIDLWGVIHNGIQLYPGAIDVLRNLNKLNKRFVLISNAPRPSKSVEKYLLNLKMDKVFLKNIFTSGEAALQILKKNTYGNKFFHLGPERDKDLIFEFRTNKLETVTKHFRPPKIEKRAKITSGATINFPFSCGFFLPRYSPANT